MAKGAKFESKVRERDAADSAERRKLRRKQRKLAIVADAAVKAVIEGNIPILDGLPDFGTRAVYDPLELKEVADGKRDPSKLKERVKITHLREDPIGQMAKRKQIEPLHLEAARRWQALHDNAQIGGARGIDPTNFKVDGGGQIREPVSDMQRAAIVRLHHINVRLGDLGAMIVQRVLGDRMTVAQLAAIMGVAPRSAREAQTQREHIGWLLRMHLDKMVEVMGLTVQGRRPQLASGAAAARDAEYARNAQYADNPALHAAVRRAREGR